jgi:hypothetical protein
MVLPGGAGGVVENDRLAVHHQVALAAAFGELLLADAGRREGGEREGPVVQAEPRRHANEGEGRLPGGPVVNLVEDGRLGGWRRLPVVDGGSARVGVPVVPELVADLDDGPVELGEPGRVGADRSDVVGPGDERAPTSGGPGTERTLVIAAVGERR